MISQNLTYDTHYGSLSCVWCCICSILNGHYSFLLNKDAVSTLINFAPFYATHIQSWLWLSFYWLYQHFSTINSVGWGGFAWSFMNNWVHPVTTAHHKFALKFTVLLGGHIHVGILLTWATSPIKVCIYMYRCYMFTSCSSMM